MPANSKTAKKVRKPRAKKEVYTASIRIWGKVYSSKGGSVKEALEGLEGRNVRGHGILTISHGEAKKDKVLSVGQVFRLFSASPMMKEIAVKQLTMMFEGI